MTEVLCADGGRLRYSMEGSGEPVVLLHGFALDRSMWDLQWMALQREFRVIRYDARGFGASTVPAGPYCHSEDLLALLDDLEARPAHIVGLSMGGSFALRFALDHPSSVRSLCLIDPALEGFSWSTQWTLRMRAIAGVARSGDIQAAKQKWWAHELFAPARRNPGIAAALAGMVERYSGWHWCNADPAHRAASPAIQTLAAVSCPTLVIQGELDLPDFEAIARRLAAQIPDATRQIIAGAGHMANMEAPDAVNRSLLTHLRC